MVTPWILTKKEQLSNRVMSKTRQKTPFTFSGSKPNNLGLINVYGPGRD